MSDHGAKALAKRLWDEFSGRGHRDHDTGECDTCDWYRRLAQGDAKDILGTTGLFIADVTKHAPSIAWDRNDDAYLVCSCGWDEETPTAEVASYYDHIGAEVPR